MRKVTSFAAALMAALVVMGALAEEAEEQPAWTGYVNVASDSYLCVRAKPQVGATVKYKLERGMDVQVVGEKGGWCEVLCGEDGGWCKGEYLVDAPVPEEDAEPKTGVIVGDGRVAVRDAPNGKRVRWVRPGDAVAVSGSRLDSDGGEWVIVGGCYIKADFVEVESNEQ